MATIGSYDGLHLGHQALIERLGVHGTREAAADGAADLRAAAAGIPAAQGPARAADLAARALADPRAGSLEALCLLRFGEALRNLSADSFARLLAQELGARTVVVGHDFRFGRNGAATAQMLAEAGARLGFAVDVVDPVQAGGERVSSSGVRAALAGGDFAGASGLARAALVDARPGRARRAAGPHAGLPDGEPCASSARARRCRGYSRCACTASQGSRCAGVASLGTRPTVAGTQPLLEAHVFDFSGDLYGREIEVEFVAKLRDEENFASLEALTEQMHRDARTRGASLNA